MYAEFYGFRDLPFRITPDPRFLYRNPCYEEAAAALRYGIEHRKGFLSLVGEAGTGKTTLLRYLLDSLPANTRTVLLLHPTVSFDEILEYILQELGVPTDGARKLTLLQRLNEFLLEHTRAGGNVALMVDESQDLDARTMEELRLLSNLETGSEKILQILLAGQPELEKKLAQPGLRQLRQRIAMHVRLRPLSPAEVAAYVRTRLEHAGSERLDVFTPDALARIADVTNGIPRLVNVLCDACLVTGVAHGSKQVTASIVEEAWADYSRLLPPEEETPAPVASAPVAAAPPPAAAAPTAAPPAAPAPEPAPAIAPEPPRLAPVPPPPPADDAPGVAASAAAAPRPLAAVTPIRPAAAAMAGAAAAVAAPEPEPEPEPAAPPDAERPVAIPVAPVPADEPTAPRRRGWGLAAGLVALLAVAAAGLAIGTGAIPVRLPSAPRPVALPPAPPPAAAVPVAPPAPQPPPPPADTTVADARAAVQAFRLAYEDRDVARLMAMFAPDATENGRTGLETIAQAYRSAFAQIDDVRYTLRDPEVSVDGARVVVRGPFSITYRQPPAGSGEMHGIASWTLERRDGALRIVALDYAFAPAGAPAPAAP